MATIIAGLSTTTAIGIGASWVSAWTAWSGYTKGYITVRTDTSSTILVDYSIDGITTDYTISKVVSSSGSGSITYKLDPFSGYIRLTVTNNVSPTPQTVTRVQTIMNIISTPAPTTVISKQYMVLERASANVSYSTSNTKISSGYSIISQDSNNYWSIDGSGHVLYTGPVKIFRLAGYVSQTSSTVTWFGNVFLKYLDNQYFGQTSSGDGSSASTNSHGVARFPSSTTGAAYGYLLDEKEEAGGSGLAIRDNEIIMDSVSWFSIYIGYAASAGTSTGYYFKLMFIEK